MQIVLRLKNGESAEIISDEFSILPAPPNAPQAAKVAAAALGITTEPSGMKPAFAGTGSCVSSPWPSLNYNMGYPIGCDTNYSGEPALAQNPTDPTRFHSVTGGFKHIRSRQVNWGYSGTSTTGSLNFNFFTAIGDLTVEIGIDGKVYAVGLGRSSSSSFPDAVLVFRSTDGGATFATGVAIPKPSELIGARLDKPVIAVHPTNAQVLVITFRVLTGSYIGTWYATCKAAPAGNLGISSNWIFTRPVDSIGNPIKDWSTVHPLIDPVSVGSPYYWLFVVLTNDEFSGGSAGMSIYKYQVNNSTQQLENGGLPVQTLFEGLAYPLWDRNPSCRKVELALRMVDSSCNRDRGNITKAAIDYCDPNAHRMYIPTHANTSGSLSDGLTSDLFLTVWTYTGTNQGRVTRRILPGEKEKYVACAVTDGHGRVWVNAYVTASTTDTHRAQIGAIAIDRITGEAHSMAYMSLRVPINLSYASTPSV